MAHVGFLEYDPRRYISGPGKRVVSQMGAGGGGPGGWWGGGQKEEKKEKEEVCREILVSTKRFPARRVAGANAFRDASTGRRSPINRIGGNGGFNLFRSREVKVKTSF